MQFQPSPICKQLPCRCATHKIRCMLEISSTGLIFDLNTLIAEYAYELPKWKPIQEVMNRRKGRIQKEIYPIVQKDESIVVFDSNQSQPIQKEGIHKGVQTEMALRQFSCGAFDLTVVVASKAPSRISRMFDRTDQQFLSFVNQPIRRILFRFHVCFLTRKVQATILYPPSTKTVDVGFLDLDIDNPSYVYVIVDNHSKSIIKNIAL